MRENEAQATKLPYDMYVTLKIAGFVQYNTVADPIEVKPSRLRPEHQHK